MTDSPTSSSTRRKRLGRGSRLGSFELLEEIGAGGAARVFRARHTHPSYSEHVYAVKVLRPNLAADPEIVERFRREGYVLSMLQHPNIVRTFDSGIENAALYIVMQFVDGIDLLEVLNRIEGTPIPTAIAAHIAHETLMGLHFAHTLKDSGELSLDIRHQDIKPSNILVSRSGDVKLTDFGVAAITRGNSTKSTDLIMGTRGYFAPEELSGAAVDHRSDLFAVGVILHEMLSGQPLFEADETTELLLKNERAKVPKLRKLNSEVPAELDRVVARALERKPDKRFRDALQMAEALAPFTGKRTSMPLAVASLMRTILARGKPSVNPYGRSRTTPTLPNNARVILCSRNAAWERPLWEATVDTWAAQIQRVGTLTQLRSELAPGPCVLFVDMDDLGQAPTAILEALDHLTPTPPIVAITKQADVSSLEAAFSLGARDVLWAPVSPRRAAVALRGALEQAALGQVTATPVASAESPPRGRLLLVSEDPQLVARSSQQLMNLSFVIDASPTQDEALQRMHSANYHGVLVDLLTNTNVREEIVDRIRQCQGMGVVPIVFLAATEEVTELRSALPPRCVARRRSDSPVVLVQAVSQLRAQIRHGRTHVRYVQNTEAQLRYQGQDVSAEVLDISRGGMRLKCRHIPAMGTVVQIQVSPTSRTPSPRLRAVVVRVEPPDGDSNQVGLGVELLPDEPQIEYLWASFVRRVAEHAPAMPVTPRPA